MKHFGERLRRLRGDRSQKAVAEALGMPQTTLSSLEKQTAIPRGDTLKRLADFFGVPITYFYTQELKPSETAKDWLTELRSEAKVRDTIAAHSATPLDPGVRDSIASKLRKLKERLDAEASH